MFANATNFYRKSGAAQWRDLCVDAPSWRCFSTERNVVQRSAVSFSCSDADSKSPEFIYRNVLAGLKTRSPD
jgi:hypothetical protein